MEEKQRDSWGSRLGYVLSMIALAVGLGAIWRFPTIVAQNGGGAFVLAYVIVTICIVVPGGWAEISFGKWANGGAVTSYGKLFGKKGRVAGALISMVPIMLNMYYTILIGRIFGYFLATFKGSYFDQPAVFFDSFEANKVVSFALTLIVILTATFIVSRGVKGGIEKFNKIALPLLFFTLVVMTVRVLFLPGIAEGLDFYLKPDFSKLLDPSIWVMAGSMAFFAIGLGPAYLIVNGSYLEKDAPINEDYVTVALWNMLGSILAGFAIVPAVVYFNIPLDTGQGLVFQALPVVFDQITGGRILAAMFFLALAGAGMSSAVSSMEIGVTALQDGFNWTRKKSVAFLCIVIIAGAAPAVWSAEFFAGLDWFVSNIGYTFTALMTAVVLAWYIKAKKVRIEWMNPTSELKVGSWFDVVYKFIVCPILFWFALQSFVDLIKMLF